MPKKISILWIVAVVALSSRALALSCVGTTPEDAARHWSQAQHGQSLQQDSQADGLVGSPTGYRVQQVMRDPVLHNQWLLVADCAHPARPLIAIAMQMEKLPRQRSVQPRVHETFAISTTMQTPHLPAYLPVVVRQAASSIEVDASRWRAGQLITSVPAPLLVHAGDRVVLWNQEPQLRMAIAAIALEYGHAGQVIHLRRDQPNTVQNATLTGVVRGPGSVELMP